MSFNNLSLRPWTSPKDGSVRVYINSRFVERRGDHGMWSHADGAYLKARDDGSIGWDSPRLDMSGNIGMGCQHIVEQLGLVGQPFAELLRRITLCQTAKGNFSFRQYDKRQAANNWT